MSFKIDDKEYNINLKFNNNIEIKSAAKNYVVDFTKEGEGISNLIETFNDQHDYLIIDNNVFNLYDKYFSTLKDSRVFKVDAIEDNKTLEQCINIFTKLSDIKFTKKGKLIVVGGGIIQDLSTLVAALYKRGINWVLYPTTLLSMSDSCVGSKSSINFQSNKNQLGLFFPPNKIVIDSKFLRTLEERELYSGLGEILKLHLIGGTETMEKYNIYVEHGKVKSWNSYNYLIYQSLMVKKPVIEEDEFDNAQRRALNYGHTIGHAIEALTHYTIPHGQAIAIGMLLENIVSDNGIQSIHNNIIDIIPSHQLSVLKDINIDNLYDIIKTDKKIVGNSLNFISLRDIGISVINPVVLDDNFKIKIGNAFQDLLK